ncbi:MAG: flagellar basal body-associated FliL family protein [Oceanicaulis sp.]
MADEAEDDIEDGAEAEGVEGEKKKGGIKKLALFIGLPVVILILAGVAGALLLFGGGEDETAVAEGGEAVEEEIDPAAELTAYFDRFEQSGEYSVTANIADENGGSLVMQLKFAIVYDDHSVSTVLAHPDFEPRLRDTMIDFARTLRVEDLDGSMGNYRIKAELLRRVNLLIAPMQAEDVLIVDLVMG